MNASDKIVITATTVSEEIASLRAPEAPSTEERYVGMIEEFLNAPQHARARSTMPTSLWVTEPQVLASRLSEVYKVIDPLRDSVPVDLYRTVCEYCRNLTI